MTWEAAARSPSPPPCDPTSDDCDDCDDHDHHPHLHNIVSAEQGVILADDLMPGQRDCSFICISDLTPQARIIYASPSAWDVVGFRPSELVGMSIFDVMHPNELDTLRVVQENNANTDGVARLLCMRGLRRSQPDHPNGDIAAGKPASGDNEKEYMEAEVLVSTCYDCEVAIVAAKHSSRDRMAWRSDAAQVIRVGPDGQLDVETRRRRRNQRQLLQLFEAQQFRRRIVNAGDNGQENFREPRCYFILDRFSVRCHVEFASATCQLLLGAVPTDICGRPFFEFVGGGCGERRRVEMAVGAVKTDDGIGHVRFKWAPSDVAVEMIVSGCCDGLVCILRRDGSEEETPDVIL